MLPEVLIGHEDGRLINGGVQIYSRELGQYGGKDMKAASLLTTATTFYLLATQASAAVDITGFTVGGGGTPIGLIAISLLLLGIGASAIKRA